MRTVQKVLLDLTKTKNVVSVHDKGWILSVRHVESFIAGMSSINMWVDVDTDEDLVERTFVFVTPGQEIPDNYAYIDTVVMGTFAMVIYEDRPLREQKGYVKGSY